MSDPPKKAQFTLRVYPISTDVLTVEQPDEGWLLVETKTRETRDGILLQALWRHAYCKSCWKDWEWCECRAK